MHLLKLCYHDNMVVSRPTVTYWCYEGVYW